MDLRAATRVRTNTFAQLHSLRSDSYPWRTCPIPCNTHFYTSSPAKLTTYASIVFAGHDASRALAKTSLKPEDISPVWHDLPESEKNTLNDWYTFFSKRYNIIGHVEGATNME